MDRKKVTNENDNVQISEKEFHDDASTCMILGNYVELHQLCPSFWIVFSINYFLFTIQLTIRLNCM